MAVQDHQLLLHDARLRNRDRHAAQMKLLGFEVTRGDDDVPGDIQVSGDHHHHYLPPKNGMAGKLLTAGLIGASILGAGAALPWIANRLASKPAASEQRPDKDTRNTIRFAE